MFCVGESKWALLRVHVSTERVLVLGTACRWQSMWVNNQPYARPSRMYINAGRCVGACFTAETLGYNWCISLLSAWFDGIFDDAPCFYFFYFLFAWLLIIYFTLPFIFILYIFHIYTLYRVYFLCKFIFYIIKNINYYSQ